MGWGNCGTDSNGRPIGYVFKATCDRSGCDKKIDRGLSFACGDMHGEDELSCEKYFCDNHKSNYVMDSRLNLVKVCDGCFKGHLDSGEWFLNADDVLIQSGAEIKYKGSNLGAVLDFVGKHENFEKWFPTFSDYLLHVDNEGGLFKIISGENKLNVNIGDSVKMGDDGLFHVVKASEQWTHL